MDSNEAFPSMWLGADNFKGTKNVNLIIEDAEMEIIGQKKENKLIVSFVGLEKRLILNKTNWKKIMEITGSSETDKWEGVEVGISTPLCFNPDKGQEMPALRIVEAYKKGEK